ncbi:MAG TPA: PIG-L family deacetylase [Bacteriovoracaceae bacterium]|nr:PIG-L family deacetylase [Bacteriovoracaceae bacterium]
MEFTPLLKSLGSFFAPSTIVVKNPIPLVVMILSPHPDDESIVGSLALRLRRENKVRIINVAVTLGSKKERQKERCEELSKACELLEMECVYLDESWSKKAKELKSLLKKYQPALIIAPHLKDFHPTHIKTGHLLREVLLSSKTYNGLVAWSEFWGQMSDPNILLEVPIEILELQMRALQLHVGEVSRNPYHLRLPAWMMDNVRRGSEVISGKGVSAPPMAYGVIYKLQHYRAGRFTSPKLDSPFLSCQHDLGQIFKLILDAASGSKTKMN